eukprot:m.104120 g.104120  ORF g.104120 m.104120 type:complete len:77 (-) comp15064_c1_seq2:1858-2088(-)
MPPLSCVLPERPLLFSFGFFFFFLADDDNVGAVRLNGGEKDSKIPTGKLMACEKCNDDERPHVGGCEREVVSDPHG